MGRQDAETETLIPTGGCFDGGPTFTCGGCGETISEAWGWGEWCDYCGHEHAAPPLPFDTTQITSAANYSSPKPGDACHPLAAGAHAPAVAFQSSQSGVRVDEVHATLDSNNGSRRHNGALLGMAVRRLTPRECERLQGFPDVHDFVRIDVCEDENSESARSAAETSLRQKHGPSEHVAAHVLIDCEQQVLRLHSRGKLLWTASIAANESSSLLSIPSGDFARVVARMRPMLARQTHAGVVALPPSIKPSIAPSSGNAHVRLCGREIRALASDADKFTAALNACLKSTIAQPGSSSQPSALTLETLCSCVAAAMTGCIQETTQGASSYTLTLEVVTPYTLLPGKAADGPRYKALGNSMAVPVMRFIGERIAEVDAITNPKELAA